MRKHIALALAAAFALASTAALAALDGTHHDMTLYQGDPQVCFQCHGKTDTNDAAPFAASVGKVGALCIGRCHNGGGVVAPNGFLIPWAPNWAAYTGNDLASDTVIAIEDETITYFDTGSHSNSIAALLDPYDLATPVDISVSGFPYTGAGNTEIQCSSCHSVHDNANTPFLWDAYRDGVNGTFFCTNCHTGRGTNDLSIAPDGNHPVNFIIDSTAASTRATLTRLGRRIAVDAAAPGRYFDVSATTPEGGNMNNDGKNPALSYALGGKLDTMTVWTGAGSTQYMSCYTCHTVHGDFGASGFLQLTTAPYKNLAVVGQNPICMGCHGAGATVLANYAYSFLADGNVGVTNYGHGVNAETTEVSPLVYLTSVGNIQITINDPTAGVDLAAGLGPQGQVLCSSCHDIHGGRDKIIYLNAPDPVCNGCHNGVGLPDVEDLSEAGVGEGANAHHRTAVNTGGSPWAPAIDGDGLNMPAQASWWNGAVSDAGDLSDGLQCADCHVSNGTAHNW